MQFGDACYYFPVDTHTHAYTMVYVVKALNWGDNCEFCGGASSTLSIVLGSLLQFSFTFERNCLDLTLIAADCLKPLISVILGSCSVKQHQLYSRSLSYLFSCAPQDKGLPSSPVSQISKDPFVLARAPEFCLYYHCHLCIMRAD